MKKENKVYSIPLIIQSNKIGENQERSCSVLLTEWVAQDMFLAVKVIKQHYFFFNLLEA